MIVKEISCQEPAEVFKSFRKRPYSFFLDSGMDLQRLGRYSMIGSDPFLVFTCKDETVELFRNGNRETKRGDPFQILRELITRYRAPSDPRFPTGAGAFGYFAYDLGRQIEKLPRVAQDDLGLPDCYLGFYDRLIICDHQQNKMFLVSTGLPEQGGKADIWARERLQELEGYIYTGEGYGPQEDLSDFTYDRCKKTAGKMPVIRGHFSYDTYCAAVQQVKDYISKGEILEAILSQRFSCELQIDSWQLYRRLRKINPAPFAAYLHYPQLDIVCSSPERFMKVTDRNVETRPIKGTRPRGKDAREDRRLRAELLQSDKDHAELDMITSLVRNELRQVCSKSSVKVQERFRLEEYPTVFHLVSTVRGRLAEGKDIIDLLQASFPAGSISGNPKQRAMEIIEELEPVKRGIYTGSIGYLGFDGNVDLNVVIRTIIVKTGTAYLQVGGGIILSSRPDEEYRETIAKAQALLKALGHEGEVKVCL